MKNFACQNLLPLFFSVFLLVACHQKTKDIPSLFYTVEESASVVEWKGYLNDSTGNNGTIKVKGTLSTNESGLVKQGEFYLPLASLENLNLPVPELKQQLIHHLQSADFFNMALYPEIHFLITEISPDTEKETYRAKGDLTFLGKTVPVVFPAKITGSDTLLIEGNATIDRTLWGMTYASDENATDGMYVKPFFDINLKVTAVKTALSVQ